MKFICDQSELVSALNIASKAISSRSTLPILKGILLSCNKEKGILKMSSSDLEISIDTCISAHVEEDGEIIVYAKLFSDIIRKLNSGSVSFELVEGNKLNIINGTYNSNILGLEAEAEDFPKIEENAEGVSFSLEKEMLKDMIKGTSFAVSIDEVRGIITGTLLEIKKDEICMVALDGFRMAIRREKVKSEEEKNIIIAGRIINEIGKLLSENTKDDDITIKVSDNKAYFIMMDTVIVTKLMDGDFIKYKDIIPKESSISVLVNKRLLIDCVDRASIIGKEGNNAFIKFEINEDELIISSRADQGTTEEVLPVDKDGDNIKIGFNSRFMIDALKAIYDENILMLFNMSVGPCLIKPVKGDSFEYLVLPVRLSSVDA